MCSAVVIKIIYLDFLADLLYTIIIKFSYM